MSLLEDRNGRRFHYLRLSITDACNFRCAYCLPNGYRKCADASEPLRVDEIRNLVSAFAGLGLRKVRLTGGEPTLRRDLLEVMHAIAAAPGVRKVALSTNGGDLKQKARAYRAAGVTAVNVSVDSLDRDVFKRITGMDRLPQILDGIEEALGIGFDSVKINTVLLKGINDSALGEFLEFVKDRPVSLRLIELMRTGDSWHFFRDRHLGSARIRGDLESAGWKLAPRGVDDGPAQEFVHPDYRGRIGLIAPYSSDFCKTCNRLRVTSAGNLRLCLFGEKQFSLRPYLQSPGQKDELIERVCELIGFKPAAHFLHEENSGMVRALAEVGG